MTASLRQGLPGKMETRKTLAAENALPVVIYTITMVSAQERPLPFRALGGHPAPRSVFPTVQPSVPVPRPGSALEMQEGKYPGPGLTARQRETHR